MEILKDNQIIKVIILMIAAFLFVFSFQDEEKKEIKVDNMITIKQGTVGNLENGVRVGCSYIFKDKYTLADGSQKNGLTAGLSLWNNNEKIEIAGCPFELKKEGKSMSYSITVGVGSRIVVNGENYHVNNVSEKKVANFFYSLFHSGETGGDKSSVSFYRVK